MTSMIRRQRDPIESTTGWQILLDDYDTMSWSHRRAMAFEIGMYLVSLSMMGEDEITDLDDTTLSGLAVRYMNDKRVQGGTINE